MSTLLSYKEDSLRKLKETMRKSQQEGEKSCEFAVSEELVWQPGRGGGLASDPVVSNSVQEGKDIHAKLTNPKGWAITSSLSMEKKKLEEEVQQLHMKTVQLER